MITHIAFDEAGNTGDDLLNKDQKVFTLASNNFNTTELSQLFSSFENNSEAHFVKLKNSQKGRKQLIDFINHELITDKNVLMSVCHKEFAVVSQLVDQIYEPHYHSLGIDIYENNFHMTLANMIYYLGEIHWSREEYLNFLKSFVKFIRTKDKNTFVFWGKAIDELREVISKIEIEIFIFPLLQPETFLSEVRAVSNKYTLDFTLSLFLTHCDKWYKKTGNKLSVQFDNSKQIEYYKEHINWVKTLNCSDSNVGFGDKTMVFPAQIESLDLVDSEDSLSIQCSDILASTLSFYYNNTNSKHERFREQIKQSRLFQLANFHNIWPSIDNIELKAKSEKGTNIIDFLTQFRDSYPGK